MKQLLIISGKGGTGKTTVAGAFIRLSNAQAYADCDVDAPNLHLIMAQKMKPKRKDYYGLPKAQIHYEICTKCNECSKNCRFDAIIVNDRELRVDQFACEGCGVCEAICPTKAITLVPDIAGELLLYANKKTVFSTAQLKMGSGTSGLLVTEVKKQMKSAVKNVDLAIIDGSPGIGCPVIASLSGADIALIVAEPSVSGISDMNRIIRTAEGLGTNVAVCINKYDTNIKKAKEIELICKIQRISYAGKISFDSDVVKAINNGYTIVDVPCRSGNEVKQIFSNVINLLSSM